MGQGIEHLFFYPEQAQENYCVNQYVNADAGAQGLAEIVKDISDAAIKVRFLCCPFALLSALHKRHLKHQPVKCCSYHLRHSACQKCFGRVSGVHRSIIDIACHESAFSFREGVYSGLAVLDFGPAKTRMQIAHHSPPCTQGFQTRCSAHRAAPGLVGSAGQH